jgi:hypothetical protein
VAAGPFAFRVSSSCHSFHRFRVGRRMPDCLGEHHHAPGKALDFVGRRTLIADLTNYTGHADDRQI